MQTSPNRCHSANTQLHTQMNIEFHTFAALPGSGGKVGHFNKSMWEYYTTDSA